MNKLQQIREAHPNTKHGFNTRAGASRTYSVWAAMKQRCLNPNDKTYYRYGGRGITISEEWLDFRNFIEDMGIKPYGKLLDRIDNDKGYCKENCRWATQKQSANNKRNNVLLTYKGVTLTASQWGRRKGISAETLYSRIKRGLSTEDVLNKKLYAR